jgi:hypothetical protein
MRVKMQFDTYYRGNFRISRRMGKQLTTTGILKPKSMILSKESVSYWGTYITRTSSQKIGYNILALRWRTYLLGIGRKILHMPNSDGGVRGQIDLGPGGEETPDLALRIELGAEARG